jgi:hypothetical protein
MDRSLLFYVLLGAGVVLVPAISDRLLKGRVADGLRVVLGFIVAAATALVLVLIARPLGL